MKPVLSDVPEKLPRTRQEQAKYLAEHERHEPDYHRPMTYSMSWKVWSMHFPSPEIKDAVYHIISQPYFDLEPYQHPLDAFIEKYKREGVMWSTAGRSGGHVVLMWNGHQAIDADPYDEISDWHWTRWYNKTGHMAEIFMNSRRTVLYKLIDRFNFEGYRKFAEFLKEQVDWFTLLRQRPYMQGDEARWWATENDLQHRVRTYLANAAESTHNYLVWAVHEKVVEVRHQYEPDISVNPYVFWPADLLTSRTQMIYDFDWAVNNCVADLFEEAKFRLEQGDIQLEADTE